MHVRAPAQLIEDGGLARRIDAQHQQLLRLVHLVERIVGQPLVLEHFAEAFAQRMVLGREPLEPHVDEPGDGVGIVLFRDDGDDAPATPCEEKQG